MHNDQILRQYRKALISRGRAQGTIQSTLFHLNEAIRFTGVDLITPKVEEIVQYINKEGVKQATKYARYTTFLAFYRWLWEEQKVLINPMDKVPKCKPPEKFPKRIMTWGETQKVLEYFSDDPSNPNDFTKRCYLELLYSGSLRPGEALSLNMSDFDPHHQTVTIRPEVCKTRKGRIAPIGNKACELLNTYLNGVRDILVERTVERNRRARLKNQYLSNTRIYHPDPEALLLNCFGVRLTFQTVQVMMSKMRKKLKLRSNPSLHSMRKSSGTHMLRNKAPLVTVARILGHARDSDATMLYTKVYNEDLHKMHCAHHPREKQKNFPMPKLEKPFFWTDARFVPFQPVYAILRGLLQEKHPRAGDDIPELKIPKT